jgi:hypothetical protein
MSAIEPVYFDFIQGRFVDAKPSRVEDWKALLDRLIFFE